jgi:hypothetical protein
VSLPARAHAHWLFPKMEKKNRTRGQQASVEGAGSQQCSTLFRSPPLLAYVVYDWICMVWHTRVRPRGHKMSMAIHAMPYFLRAESISTGAQAVRGSMYMGFRLQIMAHINVSHDSLSHSSISPCRDSVDTVEVQGATISYGSMRYFHRADMVEDVIWCSGSAQSQRKCQAVSLRPACVAISRVG